MVNLLGRRVGAAAPPCFEAAESDRIEARLCALFASVRDNARVDRREDVVRAVEDLAAELDELDATPTRLAAEGLLEALDRLRGEARASAAGLARAERSSAAATARPVEGDFFCHRPGRSLGTGEAEIASRGLVDAWDRPPLGSWIGALPATSEGVEDGVWIVAWVESRDLERARAGCRACPNGALAHIDDVSAPAAAQLWAAARAAARSDRR